LNWIDIAFIAVIVVSALIGVARGLVREVLSLVVWAAALAVGWFFHREVADLLTAQIAEPSVRLGVAFVGLVLAVLVLGAILGALLSLVIDKVRLSGVDRGLGLAFGAARGVVLVAMAVFLASLTPMPEEAWWKESQTIGQFQSVADWMLSLVPQEVQEQLKRV
jgi:membrane protein required for colicin V production